MIGSHGDSVVDAGKYDGPLGVLSAIQVVQTLNDRGIQFDSAVEVVCFADEEGVRYQSTFLGSRAIAGTFNVAVLARKDKDGISLDQAMRDFGLNPEKIGEAARKPGEILCYLEVHIEQGPVLESEDRATAAVTAIAGANRMTVTVFGETKVASLFSMETRIDELAAASEAVLALEAIATESEDTVGTVGQVEVISGATGTGPDKTVFSVDLRAAQDEVRCNALDAFLKKLDEICDRRKVSFHVDHSHKADGVECAPWMVDQIENAMADLGNSPFRLPSGAGHDAAAMAEITDVGMIFVRCKAGVSHSPLEHVTREDAEAGAELLLRTVERIGGLKR
jgi:allantoate deiminase